MTIKDLFDTLPIFQEVKVYKEFYNKFNYLQKNETKSVYKGHVKNFKHIVDFTVIKIMVENNVLIVFVR